MKNREEKKDTKKRGPWVVKPPGGPDPENLPPSITTDYTTPVATKDRAVYGENRLRENKTVGMSKVDPADIRPPQILLAQKLSDFSLMTDKAGAEAAIGQYFHTGKQEIYDTFECYCLFAAKTQYIDRRKPEEGKKDQYQVIGVMAEDETLFGMNFRSSAQFALSKLFTTVHSLNRPMYSIKCQIEAKELSGEKGNWFVPVIRIKEPETDPEKLLRLEEKAKAIDQRAEQITTEDLGDMEESLHQ